MKIRSKATLLIAVLGCSMLSSCGLISSAARLPGGLLKAAGRTAGLPVSQADEELPRSSQPRFEVVEGEILHHD